MRLRVAAVAAALFVVAAPAHAARIVGTVRADVLHGTARADTVAGRAGNDRIDVAGGGADRVSCGPGADLVLADGSDRIGSDCETVMRRIAIDPFAAGGAAHATIVEPDAYAWGSTVVADFQVGRIADGGSLAIGWATSKDAGRTWRNGLLPRVTTATKGPWLRASDPVVAFDSAHGVWLASTLAIGMTNTALLVAHSTDGIHWSAPVTATTGQNDNNGNVVLDKDWIACDNQPGSPFAGHCYLSYSDFVAGRMSTQTSTDGGLTWGPRQGSADLAGSDGMNAEAPAPQPMTIPGGTLVIPIFEDDRMSAVRSLDGGATFTDETTIAPIDDADAPFRAGPLPSGAWDSTSLFLAWSDGNRMQFTRSTDGVAWSPPTVVPLGTGRAFLPGLGARWQASGRLGLAAYVWSEAAKTLRVVFTSSQDGGTTWAAPRPLSVDAMPLSWIAPTTLGRMVGDYVATAIAGNRAVPVVVMAQKPAGGKFREAVYAGSIPLP